ncbi:hypothetical protein HPB52_002345 [Rhipicephalus sanguineus]|uniref:Uncharacterized protein n=1 Tax=Rhipicephalus sanguineus TaxID=34632 RepID=A0A9D4Q4H4_RHISA|nr:hypothetical protein HPB52_002345 [Rhipicephalus sanguineus]
MFQPAEAWQPQFDPPLPPFRTYNLESWFEEFAAALELNGIWLQAFMFEVLEYHLPRDLKRSLTYFAWRPRPYDDLRDAPITTGYTCDGDHPPAPISCDASNARLLALRRPLHLNHPHHRQHQRIPLLGSLPRATHNHRGPRPLHGSQCRPPELARGKEDTSAAGAFPNCWPRRQ